jgi:imidazolonepropionase-like amidohydrolase
LAEKAEKAEKGEPKSSAAEGDKPAEKPVDKPVEQAGDEGATDGGSLQDPPAEGAATGGAEGGEAASAAATSSAMQDLLSGKIRAFVYCQNAADVGQAFRLMDEFKFAGILVLGPECYPAAAEIAKRGATVILDPTLVYWKRDPVTRKEEKIVLPKIYREAGVKYLFQSNDSDSRQSLGSSYFWFQAATAVSYGMSREEALAALTLEPAKLLGVDAFVGSIEPGRDADLVILTGDPLDVSTWVETTVVNGKVVYQRAEDWKLKLLLEAAPQ